MMCGAVVAAVGFEGPACSTHFATPPQQRRSAMRVWGDLAAIETVVMFNPIKEQRETCRQHVRQLFRSQVTCSKRSSAHCSESAEFRLAPVPCVVFSNLSYFIS
ncbi:hypothetical protein E2C01_013333 [Portunus trituberculatus]|uniref:Uncharacterized protein n=1 Tax=Portunus trituberculatus TaxID=210409 RepID=A0A5B7DFY9_PORTR|nr:hypothetical protein [Portunus trituberculatus]